VNQYPHISKFLPTTAKEAKAFGWDQLDVVLFTGDAYIDHPAFGIPVIGRILHHAGYKVAIVPQPNWQDDLRDFTKFGKPRLFFGVSAGAMDSMVNHYTARKRLRSNDAYTPGNMAGFRPDYPSIVYTKALKKHFPDVPVILGGVEASLRRFSHYDYWQDKILPGILTQSGADMLVYGMGEKSILELAQRIDSGEAFASLKNLKQTAVLLNESELKNTLSGTTRKLHSHEDCLTDKRKYAENFALIETESNRMHAAVLIQKSGRDYILVNPPHPTPTEQEIDAYYDLPYTRLPHPKYRKKKPIPAYEMIRHSVNTHRGCFGGCSFCTISAHQGKFVSSRSEKSILNEVEAVSQMEDFKGYVSDLGGPSANMYKMQGKDEAVCEKCKRASCIHPSICKNLNHDHRPMIELYKKAEQISGIKKITIGSGIRYDFLNAKEEDNNFRSYFTKLVRDHVSGRLKVAPEHTDSEVLKLMRKPDFELFRQLHREFERINNDEQLNQQLIPYFISSHPACSTEDMAELAVLTKKEGYKLEQVQDFTPSPMTYATVMYHSGFDPYTMKKVVTAKSVDEKTRQTMFFFWYKKEYREQIKQELRKIGRTDLIGKLLSR
jgi:uncharacterized radical SAM protein YgiQ